MYNLRQNRDHAAKEVEKCVKQNGKNTEIFTQPHHYSKLLYVVYGDETLLDQCCRLYNVIWVDFEKLSHVWVRLILKELTDTSENEPKCAVYFRPGVVALCTLWLDSPVDKFRVLACIG